MKSILKWLMSLYFAIAVITMGFQLSFRLPVCSGIGGCGLSLIKGALENDVASNGEAHQHRRSSWVGC